MDRKQVLLELYTNPRPRDAVKADAPMAREQAVRDAKAEFLAAVRRLDCYDSSLEVLGAETMFPVLVVAGPGKEVDHFSDHVMEDLPKLVRRVERDLHFAIP